MPHSSCMQEKLGKSLESSCGKHGKATQLPSTAIVNSNSRSAEFRDSQVSYMHGLSPIPLAQARNIAALLSDDTAA